MTHEHRGFPRRILAASPEAAQSRFTQRTVRALLAHVHGHRTQMPNMQDDNSPSRVRPRLSGGLRGQGPRWRRSLRMAHRGRSRRAPGVRPGCSLEAARCHQGPRSHSALRHSISASLRLCESASACVPPSLCLCLSLSLSPSLPPSSRTRCISACIDIHMFVILLCIYAMLCHSLPLSLSLSDSISLSPSRSILCV